MSQVGTAYVQIVPSAQGISGSISKVLNGEADAAGTSAGTSIASKIKGAIGAAAIGKALVDTIKEGARYEQALGGIETMFKGYADQMVQYANNAYKTAGVSANNYMEQVTSFSAALIKSVGGDTKKAGEAANQALIDMSDNANKFGTDMQSITWAYQGFAKQNYTMLDNLKLGYGGTKAEMERLLADAEKLSGQKYDISNLNDVYEAIHVIQTELGVTGTTAAEAATTLSGSFASMKAAFSNFMAQLTMGGDVTTALTNLVNSAVTFLIGNLVPALGRIVASIPSVLIGLLGTAIPQIFNGISGLLDSMSSEKGAQAAAKFVTSITSKILPALGNLITSIGNLFLKLVTTLPSIALKAATAVVTSMKNKLVSGVTSILNTLKSKFASIKLTLPHIKLPHFSISGKLSLNPPSIPKISVSWYKTGGIFNEPTIAGIGEAGSEAVVPLDQLWNRLDNMVNSIRAMGEAISDGGGRTVVEVIAEPNGIFKVVQREANNYMQATGQPAFNL